jgi:formylmethanofuran dehydrogenase subunit E
MSEEERKGYYYRLVCDKCNKKLFAWSNEGSLDDYIICGSCYNKLMD